MIISRRKFLVQLGTILSVPMFITCQNRPNKPLTIASHVWSGYELIFLARREGWLNENVKLYESLSASNSIELLEKNQVEGAALTLDEVLRARAKGIKLTVVLVFDVSTGADMLLVKPKITSLADLKNKRIGVEQSALGALMLFKILQKAQLSKNAITLVSVNVDKHYEAWQNDQIDALITFEPTASRLLNEDAKRLFDSRQIPDTIFDVLAIKTNELEKNEKALKNLIQGHFKARQHFLLNPQDAAYRMAKRLGVNGYEALEGFRGLDLPDLKTNQHYLTFENSPLLNAANELSYIMRESGLIPSADSLDNLISNQFL